MSKFESENWKIAKAKRLKSFEERKGSEPKEYFKTNSFESEFIAVNPMADEDWWFEKFNKSPEICKKVDLYWKFDGDVAFVEIWSENVSEIVWTASWRNGMLYLSASVSDELISSSTVNVVLETLAKKHLEENLFHKYYLKRKRHQL